MRRSTRTKQPRVALQVEVELGGVGDVPVDDGAGSAIAALVGEGLASGEEADVVTLEGNM